MTVQTVNCEFLCVCGYCKYMFMAGVISTTIHKTSQLSKFTQAILAVSTLLEFKSHNCQMVNQEMENFPPCGKWAKGKRAVTY